MTFDEKGRHLSWQVGRNRYLHVAKRAHIPFERILLISPINVTGNLKNAHIFGTTEIRSYYLERRSSSWSHVPDLFNSWGDQLILIKRGN